MQRRKKKLCQETTAADPPVQARARAACRTLGNRDPCCAMPPSWLLTSHSELFFLTPPLAYSTLYYLLSRSQGVPFLLG